MSLSTYFYNDPIFSLADFPSMFDEAWENRVGGQGHRRSQSRPNGIEQGSFAIRPKMDLHESAETNIVTASFELPGIPKDSVNIDVQNNRLIVSAERKSESKKEEQGYTLKERSYGKFSRTLPLPKGVKPEQVKAAMKDGVLTVTFPKTGEEQPPARITVD